MYRKTCIKRHRKGDRKEPFKNRGKRGSRRKKRSFLENILTTPKKGKGTTQPRRGDFPGLLSQRSDYRRNFRDKNGDKRKDG